MRETIKTSIAVPATTMNNVDPATTTVTVPLLQSVDGATVASGFHQPNNNNDHHHHRLAVATDATVAADTAHSQQHQLQQVVGLNVLSPEGMAQHQSISLQRRQAISNAARVSQQVFLGLVLCSFAVPLLAVAFWGVDGFVMYTVVMELCFGVYLGWAWNLRSWQSGLGVVTLAGVFYLAGSSDLLIFEEDLLLLVVCVLVAVFVLLPLHHYAPKAAEKRRQFAHVQSMGLFSSKVQQARDKIYLNDPCANGGDGGVSNHDNNGISVQTDLDELSPPMQGIYICNDNRIFSNNGSHNNNSNESINYLAFFFRQEPNHNGWMIAGGNEEWGVIEGSVSSATSLESYFVVGKVNGTDPVLYQGKFSLEDGFVGESISSSGKHCTNCCMVPLCRSHCGGPLGKHVGIRCDICKTSGFAGKRYTVQKKHYDVCETCMAQYDSLRNQPVNHDGQPEMPHRNEFEVLEIPAQCPLQLTAAYAPPSSTTNS